MILAKADMLIAERYAELAGAVGERFYPIILGEFGRTAAWLLRLKGSKSWRSSGLGSLTTTPGIWDRQIKVDAQAVKLDELARKALASYRAGKHREL